MFSVLVLALSALAATNFDACKNIPAKKYEDGVQPKKCNPARSSAIDDLLNLKIRKDFVQSAVIQTKAKVLDQLNALIIERAQMIECANFKSFECMQATALFKRDLEIRLQGIRYALALSGRSSIQQDLASGQLSPEIVLPPIGGGKTLPRLTSKELESARQIQERTLNNVNMFVPQDKLGNKHNSLVFAHQCMPALYPLWNTGRDPDIGFGKWKQKVILQPRFDPDEKPAYGADECSDFKLYAQERLMALRTNARKFAEKAIGENPLVLNFAQVPISREDVIRKLMSSQVELKKWRDQIQGLPVDDLSILSLYPAQAQAIMALHPEYCGAVEEAVTKYKTSEKWHTVMVTSAKIVFATGTCIAVGGALCGPIVGAAWSGADLIAASQKSNILKSRFAAQLDSETAVVDQSTVDAADAEAVGAATSLLTSPVPITKTTLGPLLQYASSEGEQNVAREMVRESTIGTSDEMLPGLMPSIGSGGETALNEQLDIQALERQILFTSKRDVPVARPKIP